MNKTTLLVLPLMLALAGHVHAAPRAWQLRFDGAGPLRIGMSFQQAEAVLGGRLDATPRELQATPGCDQIEHLLPDGTGVMLMFQEGVLARVDEWKPGQVTDRGVAIGDSEARLRARYPRAVRAPHAYDPDGAYFTIRDDRRHLWLRFETAKGRVTQFYAGTPDAVQATEGCL